MDNPAPLGGGDICWLHSPRVKGGAVEPKCKMEVLKIKVLAENSGLHPGSTGLTPLWSQLFKKGAKIKNPVYTLEVLYWE